MLKRYARIKLSDSKKIFLMRPDIGNEEYDALKKVLDSMYLTEGPVTQEFEKVVANYVGAKHASAMTSCTTALHTVLEVIGVKGKEVIVPDYTYPATAEAVILAGDRKSTRLNSSHSQQSRMPSSA